MQQKVHEAGPPQQAEVQELEATRCHPTGGTQAPPGTGTWAAHMVGVFTSGWAMAEGGQPMLGARAAPAGAHTSIPLHGTLQV